MVRHRVIVAGSVLILCLLAGVALTIFHYMSKGPVAPTVSKEPVIAHSTDKPDESKTTADEYDWRGSAREPKKISIPSLGIDAYIQKSGVDQNSQIAVPTNVHLAGWFTDSVLPGDKGLSIIAGHVSGKTQPGVFENLHTLQKGSDFTVTFGNNIQKTFQVISVVSVSAEEAANLLFSQNPNVKSQLNLVTCAGNYSNEKQSYDKRVVIASKLES
jgi:sortase A